MGISKHRTIFGVVWYELSNDYIFELRHRNIMNRDRVFDILPKYTINTNSGANNRLIDASYFLQFIGLDIDKKPDNVFSFINILPFDSILTDEINDIGVDEFFKNIDFKKLLLQSNIKSQNDDDFKAHQMPAVKFFIGEIQYTWSKDIESGYDELDDINLDVIGYLDNNMNSIFFEKE